MLIIFPLSDIAPFVRYICRYLRLYVTLSVLPSDRYQRTSSSNADRYIVHYLVLLFIQLKLIINYNVNLHSFFDFINSCNLSEPLTPPERLQTPLPPSTLKMSIPSKTDVTSYFVVPTLTPITSTPNRLTMQTMQTELNTNTMNVPSDIITIGHLVL